MPIVAVCRFQFAAGPVGWAEQHFVRAADLASARTAFNSLATPRMSCSRSDVLLLRAFISDLSVPGDSSPILYAPAPGTWPSAVGSFTLDPAQAILLRLGDNADRRVRSWTYMRGVPSDVVTGPPPLHLNTAITGYVANVNAYLVALGNQTVLLHRESAGGYSWHTPTALNFDALRLRRRNVGLAFGQVRGRRIVNR